MVALCIVVILSFGIGVIMTIKNIESIIRINTIPEMYFIEEIQHFIK